MGGHRKDLHWDFKENLWLSLCRHEGPLHCRGENKGSILPAVTPMNQDTTEEKKKCLGFFSCCDTQQSWSITQQSTQPLSSLQLHPIMKTTEPSSQPNRDSSSYLAILSSGREKKKRKKNNKEEPNKTRRDRWKKYWKKTQEIISLFSNSYAFSIYAVIPVGEKKRHKL